MKVVILCGGQGTRIRDVSEVLPKPMLPVGGMPILWHIMKIYAHHGFKDFILCLGYKGWMIKEFFLNYQAITSDFTMTLGRKDSLVFHCKNQETNWRITFAETGEDAKTAARIRAIREYLEEDRDELFSVTYGDGVADIDIVKLIETHQYSGLSATVTGVQPSGRFGEIELEGTRVCEFNEKPNVSSGMINGGFMIFRKSVVDKYFSGQLNQSLEQDVLPGIVKDRQVGVYQHKGSWQCVDTPREYSLLNQLWTQNKAFWRVWDKQKDGLNSLKVNEYLSQVMRDS